MMTLKAALLSVIIPVYNVEPYLEQCLDSVVNQTYNDLEIICINDGSTDNSLKILEKYQKKDKRIKLIHQENKGLSEARNAGLDVVTGEYIAFLDSDDYLELNAYEKAMEVMLADRSIDLVEFRMNNFLQDKDPLNINRKSIVTKYYDNMFTAKAHSMSPCNKVFRYKIINDRDIKFPAGLICEDNFFTNAYVISMNKSAFLNVKLYNRRIHCDSIMGREQRTDNAKKMDVYYNYDALVDFAKKHNIYEEKKDFIYGQYIGKISKFCNDNNRLMEAINHWDKKILDSDCSDKWKVVYLKKRNFIKSQMQRRGYR